ncbi:MAG: hypothetical protein HYS15_00040 [Candidatus Spechtbacteria bacterium]|nr:hypothetical protein [Candidatus Spechtbacteria bacterium]
MEFDDAKVQESLMEGRIKIDVVLPLARDLIGENGTTLAMFQHMVRKIVSKRIALLPQVDVDINGYKKMREAVLTEFANEVAEQVRVENKSVELKPMPSFDRRIIHMALAKNSCVSSQSTGEGDRRYIIVRPSSSL